MGGVGDFRNGPCGRDAAMTQNMWNVIIILGGITVFAGIITLLDWLDRRKDRQSHNRAA